LRRKGEGEGEGRERVGGRVGERERQGEKTLLHLSLIPGPIRKHFVNEAK